MATCPKCRKQNPAEAAFCGFCGAPLAQQQRAPAAASKTVFGYNVDISALTKPQQQEPAKSEEAKPSPAVSGTPAPAAAETAQPPAAAPAPAPTPAPAPPAPAGDKEPPTIPIQRAAVSAKAQAAAVPPASPSGPDLVVGRYWPGQLSQTLPVGEILVAKDVKQDVDIDLLFVKEEVFPSPLDMERARRELKQLQKVDSPFLTKILEHGKAEDGRLFIAMEPSSGLTLDQLVVQKDLALTEIQNIIKSVGNGLAEAQKMGVIHRDIAPHNIVVSEQGEVKVRGFGIAPLIQRNIFGTAEFISPEQAVGRPVDQRSNIYSLGALMYYLLTKQPPFQGSPEALLEKHQKEDPVPPSQHAGEGKIAARVETLVMKAMAKSSSRRHLTLRQFLREVESMDSSETLPAAAAQPSKPLSFVTPVHGVTALTGGDRPPSSEMPPLRGDPGQIAKIMTGAQHRVLEDSALAKTISPESLAAAEGSLAPPPLPADPGAMGVAPTVGFPGPGGAPASEPAAPISRQGAITGELSTGVSLKQAEAPPPDQRPPKPATRPPAAPPAGDDKKPSGFRETMWFFKGEVESAMAETGTEEAPAPPPPEEENPAVLAEKYVDDGSMSDEAARRLSLRTGKTQMMQQVSVPSGVVPGKKMAAEEFIDEMNVGKKVGIWVGIAIAAILLISLLIYFIF